MRVASLNNLNIAALSLVVSVAAINQQQWEELSGGGSLTDKSAKDICHMTQSDPENTWLQSGADNFISGFIGKNGPEHWLYIMDGKTTGDGLKEGVLKCEKLTDKCDEPTLESCESFTPPAFYWIRRASTNLHSLLDHFHELLQSTTIQASLNLGQMVQDFAAQPLKQDAGPNVAQILSIFANAIGIFGGFASPIGGFLGITGAIGKAGAQAALDSPRVAAIAGGAGISSNAVFIGAYHAEDGEPDTDSITLGLNNRLSQVFKFMDDTISDLAALVFAGQENVESRGMTFDYIRTLPNIRFGHAVTNPPTFSHPIAQFFGQGAFLVDVEKDGKSSLEQGFKSAIKNIQKSLIAGLLRDLKVLIVKDKSSEAQNCNKAGAKKIGEHCFYLLRVGSDSTTVPELPKEVIDAFAKPEWDIDLEKVYKNANSCQQNPTDFDGWQRWYDSIHGGVPDTDDESGYPPCFWGALPVFEVTNESRQAAGVYSFMRDGPCVSTVAARDAGEEKNFPANLGIKYCPLIPATIPTRRL